MTDEVWEQINHWVSITPLGLLILARLFGYRWPWPYWFMASGFFVSFVADLVSLKLKGDITWIVTHFYPAVQFGLFAIALGAIVWPAVLFTLPVLLWGVTPLDQPDMILKVVGACVIIMLARKHKFVWVMMAYCWVGTALWLMMTGQIDHRMDFMVFWKMYVCVRVVAISVFMVMVRRVARLPPSGLSPHEAQWARPDSNRGPSAYQAGAPPD